MDGRNLEPRSGIPAAQIALALLLAIIVAGAGLLLMIEKAQKPASAVLAFDSNAAQHVDPGLMSTREPAVALADSILTDSVVAGLARTAHPESSQPAVQVGEFRAALELTQPSGQELQVRFVDSAPARWAAMLHASFLELGTKPSAATANAVARVLAEWNPSHAAASPPVPAPAPQPPSSPAPAATAPAVSARQANTAASAPAPASESASAPHPVADGLGEVGALLSATDRDLNRVGREAGPGHRSAESSYTLSSQQHLLNTQVRAAETKVNQLRSPGTTEEVRTRLRESQEAVRSILVGGHAQHQGRYGFNAAGTSASALRRERAALLHAISVVEQQRQAIQRIESTQAVAGGEKPGPVKSQEAAAPAPSSPAAGQAASTSAASANPSSSVQEQNLPTGATNSAPMAGLVSPLSVIRMASPPESPRLWIPIAVGLACGLFYLGLAALAYRRADGDYIYQESGSTHRFITPAGPVYTPREPVRVAERRAPEPEPMEAMPRRRPPFAAERPTREAEPTEVTPRRRPPFAMESTPAASDAPASASLPLQEEAAPVAAPENSVTKPETPVAKNDRAEDSAEDAAANERLWKMLLETSVERVFQKSDPHVAKRPAEETPTDPLEPDRPLS